MLGVASAYFVQIKEVLISYPVSAAISCIIAGAVLRELLRLCRREPRRPERACGGPSNADLSAVASAEAEHRMPNAEVEEERRQ
jgi:hypothetical protein